MGNLNRSNTYSEGDFLLAKLIEGNRLGKTNIDGYNKNSKQYHYSTTSYYSSTIMYYLMCRCCRKSRSDHDEGINLDEEVRQSYDKNNFQTTAPDFELRSSGVPVGLKNIGNTCYFNS